MSVLIKKVRVIKLFERNDISWNNELKNTSKLKVGFLTFAWQNATHNVNIFWGFYVHYVDMRTL